MGEWEAGGVGPVGVVVEEGSVADSSTATVRKEAHRMGLEDGHFRITDSSLCMQP